MKSISRRNFVNKLGVGLGSAAVLNALPSFIVPPDEALPYEGRKLNIAVCGLGIYGNLIARALQTSQYCALAGIVTGTPAKAKEWKAKYNIAEKNIYNYSNFDKMISNKDIDLVYIVLPNSMHKEFTIRAAKAGKHVITEKPMATSVQDCKEMIKACSDAGVQLAVGYRLHYEPHNMEIKRLGQEKVFGPVRLVEAGFGYKTYDTSKINETIDFNDHNKWRLNKELAGGGALMDLGIYCLQASRYTLGAEPIAVTAQFGPVNNPKRFEQVEETISWQMEFPGGAIANCTTSYGYSVDRVYASADSGTFELGPAMSYGPLKGKTSKGELNLPIVNHQQAQLDGIGSVILANKKLPAHITGEEGLKDMNIITAIYEAARTGKRVVL